MRKVKWVAMAAGVVLLGAGCAGEDGVKVEAATVAKEIDAAATAAGFTKDLSIDMVGPEVKECKVDWVVNDPGKSADPKKSFADTIAGLVEAGWTEGKSSRKGYVDTKIVTKGDWEVRGAADLGEGIKAVVFAGTNTSSECLPLLIADLENGK
ncbi:hypothetical protein ACIQV3_28770 [Streptomyces sp. NPDC099050]|uniref:hypothetical protein n=1 Tax=Streptomyces sp. NPDC099050 TaxID=3366100 RepID=UPI00382BAA85